VGLTSTAPDYARFCQVMLNGGKLGNVRILSPKSVELMTHDQLGKISPEQGGLSGDRKLAAGPLRPENQSDR
jgi:CubicO group peptidase (beta-lactamase class C family)